MEMDYCFASHLRFFVFSYNVFFYFLCVVNSTRFHSVSFSFIYVNLASCRFHIFSL